MDLPASHALARLDSSGTLWPRTSSSKIKTYETDNGEIDIVVKKENVIHFIEVKTRKNNDFGNPEAFVSEAQASKISQTAELFLEKYEEESNQKFKGFIQFDIISILFEKDNLKEILHLEDAF